MEHMIADRLQQAMSRCEPPVSYGVLSQMTGIPKSALQRYVTGATAKIPYERLESIAKALGTSVGYLTGSFLNTLQSLEVKVEESEGGVRLTDESTGVQVVFSLEEWQEILDGEKYDAVWNRLNLLVPKDLPSSGINERALRAAFFDGYADDLSQEEIDELWEDAKEYIAYKLEKRKKEKRE